VAVSSGHAATLDGEASSGQTVAMVGEVSSARGIHRRKDSEGAVVLKPDNSVSLILCEFSMISNELLV
jgi:hypothetical protein